MEQRAEVAYLGHGRDSRGKPAEQVRFRLGQRRPQLMERFSPQHDPKEKPVGAKRPSRLDQLANRVVGPMQAHGVNHQVMPVLFQRQGLLVFNNLRAGQKIIPHIFESPYYGRITKGFFNQSQTILDFIAGRFLKERNRRGRRAGTVADQGRAIGKRSCHGAKGKMTLVSFQTALQLIYPPRCILCGTQVESEFGLCGPCWRDTAFISGLSCHLCGVPLPGEDEGETVTCDDCLRIARPWSAGRAAMLYHENGRKLVLALKHGDRQEIVRPAVLWLAHAARPLVSADTLIAPVPLHWTRMLRRRYNQSALLTNGLSRRLDTGHCPDLLQRNVRTLPLEGQGFDERFQSLSGTISVKPARANLAQGKTILLVDDVMTSGATLAAATMACYAAGAEDVRILVLARVAKHP